MKEKKKMKKKKEATTLPKSASPPTVIKEAVGHLFILLFCLFLLETRAYFVMILCVNIIIFTLLVSYKKIKRQVKINCTKKMTRGFLKGMFKG